MKTRLFHLHALSALHVGTGQGVGAVDLPIARSRATNLPIVAGSAIKGVLRDELKSQLSATDDQVLFGSSINADNADNVNDNKQLTHAGAVAFGDAQLLLLPIRSFAGTVAYATCPFILKRYQRDVLSSTSDESVKEFIKNLSTSLDKEEIANVVSGSILLLDNQKIALEDLDLNAKSDSQADKWADTIAQAIYPNNTDYDTDWQNELKQRFVILPDDVFSFLADTATEIRTRIKIDRNTRIVAKGALWTEENLPCETVLWGVFGISQARDKSKSAEEVSKLLPENELSIQIGGKHTVGRGLCRLMIGG